MELVQWLAMSVVYTNTNTNKYWSKGCLGCEHFLTYYQKFAIVCADMKNLICYFLCIKSIWQYRALLVFINLDFFRTSIPAKPWSALNRKILAKHCSDDVKLEGTVAEIESLRAVCHSA